MLCTPESKTLQGPWPKSSRGVRGAKSAALAAQILAFRLLPKLLTECLAQLTVTWAFLFP